MNWRPVFLMRAVVVAGVMAAVGHAQAQKATIEFNRDIRPILSENCFKCHGPDAKGREDRVRLDVRETAVAKREDGTRAITPGDPSKSLVFQRITSADPDERMPPKDSGKTLTAGQIDIIRQWIAQGAAWQPHWAFIPPRRPAIVAVGNSSPPPANPIDRIISDRLQSTPLKPSPEADRATLSRRISFDLVGLPPTAEQAERFAADNRPDAYERLIDGLLASPHFGERMAIFWLDLVRYADTVGYHGDQERSVSPYRDYVIDAFNENLPFDRFTIEQIAGDLLPAATVRQRIASGYNMLGMTTIEGGAQAKEYLAKYAADRVRATSGAWLAATLGCAECHDHKYDPYTARDFYSFAAFFADIQQPGVGNPEPNLFLFATNQQTEELTKIDHELSELGKSLDATSTDKRKVFAARIKDVKQRRANLVEKVRKTIVPQSGPPRPMRVLPRGNWLDDSGQAVTAAVPRFLHSPTGNGSITTSTLTPPAGATRLDLARWLVARENPLTARVFVNRLWKLYFGTGLSRVLDDLGSQGEWPTHPELLDWLAVEFMDSGWNVKHLVRLMVTSRTYRQSSLESPAQRRIDPANRLLSRQSRFRLPAELVRDNALAVSGLLVHRIGGESVRPFQPAGYYQYLNFPKRDYHPSTGPDQHRRGVYTHWQRTFLHPMLIAFDAPSREECCAERPVSNTPLAALALLNDPSQVEAAKEFAGRILSQADASAGQRIRWAWRQALSRPPSDSEVRLLASLFEKHRAEYARDPRSARRLLTVGQSPPPAGINPVELAAWTSIARTILNLDEALTRY